MIEKTFAIFIRLYVNLSSYSSPWESWGCLQDNLFKTVNYDIIFPVHIHFLSPPFTYYLSQIFFSLPSFCPVPSTYYIMPINAPEEIFHHILVPLNAGVPQWGLADLQLLFFRPNDLLLYWTNSYSHHHLFFLGDNCGLSSTVDEEVDDVKEPETETKMSRVTIKGSDCEL